MDLWKLAQLDHLNITRTFEKKHYNGKGMGGAKNTNTYVSRWSEEPRSLGFMFWGKPEYRWVFLTFFRSSYKMLNSFEVHPYNMNVRDYRV
jgi:hypothetical protein